MILMTDWWEAILTPISIDDIDDIIIDDNQYWWRDIVDRSPVLKAERIGSDRDIMKLFNQYCYQLWLLIDGWCY